MEKTINKNYVYKGRIIKVRNDDVLSVNGKPCQREIVEHHGGAAILAVEGDYCYLVKQYRYAYEKELFEIPAGKLEENENPQETAMRELSEEIGKKAKKLIPYGKVYPTPGYCNEIIYLYLATDMTDTATCFDDDEFLTAVKIKIDDAIKMVLNGEILDAKTVIALLKYSTMKKI